MDTDWLGGMIQIPINQHQFGEDMTNNATLEPRPCERCKGEGTTFSKGFSFEDRTYPDETKTCSRCNGEKVWKAPDFKKIVEDCTTARGASEKGKRRFRAAFPSKLNHYSDREAARSYFCWRLARFHGGKDVTMPMTADMVIGGDPFRKELDAFADELAKVVFGTDMAAAERWGKAFGII